MPTKFLQTNREKLRIAEQIRRFRRRHKLTQTDLAQLMGVTKKTVLMAERVTEQSASIGTIQRFEEVRRQMKESGKVRAIPR